ncbi:hypothetical protein [Scatolibacter rhodanostii]|uniref:hypothetical protein n=1 Tax=Scatolibacter rhodanostii TaxID=2014781 RepID=UPI000C08591D|nr:hypothetical protein [Scatolibacter rhodanostii]
MENRIIGLENLLEELNENILRTQNEAQYIGIATITRQDLEKIKGSNKKAKIRMTGPLTFADDVTPELVRETIESVKVKGKINGSIEVKEALNIL